MHRAGQVTSSVFRWLRLGHSRKGGMLMKCLLAVPVLLAAVFAPASYVDDSCYRTCVGQCMANGGNQNSCALSCMGQCSR